MPQLAYVDGRIVPLARAHVHVEDRGFQFADGVYEVAAILNGTLLDWPLHLDRLRRNLAALFIAAPVAEAALGIAARRLIAANRVGEGVLYIQVTRGPARRDHGFPKAPAPTLVMTVRRFDFARRFAELATGVGVITVNDQRWGRCDIKTTGLLANVLAKQDARAAGAFEAWFVAGDNSVREGGSTNAYIVKDGVLITHPLSAHILPGIARATLLRLAASAQISIEERAFTLAEALAADEALLTSTTAPLLPVVSIDGAAIGAGTPGPVTARLGQLMWDEIAQATGYRVRP